MLLNAPRRADDYMRAMFQRADLRAYGYASAEREDLDVLSRARQPPQLLGHLIGQFTGGAKYQRLTAEIARIDWLQQCNAEGGSLAAAGLGLRDEVHTLEHDRQALRLDWRHFGIAERVEVGQRCRAEGQGGEG